MSDKGDASRYAEVRHTRREFLVRTSIGTAGMLTGIGAWSPALAVAGAGSDEERKRLKALQEQLAIIGSSSSVKKALTQLATDPALRILTTNISQANQANQPFTGFQRSLLEGVLIVTRSPDALAALIAGRRPTPKQQQALAAIRADLHQNGAIQVILSTAQDLKRRNNAKKLTGFVDTVLANIMKPPPALQPSGLLELDAVAEDALSVIRSIAVINETCALGPLIQSRDRDLVRLLRRQPPQVVATFIPPDVLITLSLPQETDPDTKGVIKGVLELLGVVLGLAAVVFGGPVSALGLGFATLAAEAGFGAAGMDIQEAMDQAPDHPLDCNFDNDPDHPDESQECARAPIVD